MKSPRTLLLSAIVLTLAVAVLAALEFRRISETFYAQVAESEARAMRDRLGLHLGSPLNSIGLTARLLAQPRNQSLDQESAELLLLSALADEKSVDMAALSDAGGIAALVGRTDAGYLLYLRPGLQGGEGKNLLLDQNMRPTGPGGFSPDAGAAFAKAVLQAVAQPPVPPGAVPGSAAAPDAGRDSAQPVQSQPAWTDRTPLPWLGIDAISAAVPAGGTQGQGTVLSFSFGIARLAQTLQDEAAADDPSASVPLLFSLDGRMVDLAPARSPGRPAQGTDTGQLFVPYTSVDDPARVAAMAAWLGQGKPVGTAFPLRVAGAPWWAALVPLSDPASSALAGVAIPQESLMGQFLRGGPRTLLLGVGLALVLVLLGAVVVQLRRRGRFASPAFFETPEEVQALIAQGENERLEFKSTLRFNLAAGKPGKEIELAVLKTLTAYMNTDGGVLLVGVDDAGQAVGLDADRFENDDHLLRHFCGMFAQHVGTEHMRLVTFALRDAGPARVLIVSCSPSREPIFLRGVKEEEFYVRTGPSSRRLSLSEFHRRITRGR